MKRTNETIKSVVLAHVKAGKSVADTAKQYKVNPKNVYNWIAAAKKRQKTPTDNGKIKVPVEIDTSEVSMLQAEIDKLIDRNNRMQDVIDVLIEQYVG